MQVIFEIVRSLIAPLAQLILAMGGAYLATLWVVLIIWTFRDIEARSRSVITQVFATLLVVFFFLPGLLLYLILRPRETLDEAFQRALQEEYLLQDLEELPLCSTCRRYVHGDFVLCPHCHTRLRDNCPHCGRLVDLRWSVCPYCTIGLPSLNEREVQVDRETAATIQLPQWVNPTIKRLRERVHQLRASNPTPPVRRSLTTRVSDTTPPPPPAAPPVPGSPPLTANGHGPHHGDEPAPSPSSRVRERFLKPPDSTANGTAEAESSESTPVGGQPHLPSGTRHD